ncbi:MAG: 50S ribosomal protein L24 [Acidimicrobiales bacterium]
MRVRKGDRVVVRSGKYKGHRSEVVRALPTEDKVVVEGVNVAKRHIKPTRATMQGGIIDKFMPMPVSNVSVVCPSCGAPTRVGMRFDEQGNKVRVCRKCGVDL